MHQLSCVSGTDNSDDLAETLFLGLHLYFPHHFLSKHRTTHLFSVFFSVSWTSARAKAVVDQVVVGRILVEVEGRTDHPEGLGNTRERNGPFPRVGLIVLRQV
ncbi:hypothetical protein HHX47_DHR7000403, partial [Lentinula edodes]